MKPAIPIPRSPRQLALICESIRRMQEPRPVPDIWVEALDMFLRWLLWLAIWSALSLTAYIIYRML